MARKKGKKNKKNRTGLRIFLILFFVILLIIGALVYRFYTDAKNMYAQAMDVKDTAEQAVVFFNSENYMRARACVLEIQQSIKTFREELTGPLWKYGSRLPKYGPDYDAVLELLDIADSAIDDFADDVFGILSENPPSGIKLEEGYNVGFIMKYLDFAEKEIPLIREYCEKLRGIELTYGGIKKIDGYLAQAEDMKNEVLSKIDGLFELYDKAEKYFPIIRLFLGDGTDRLYLLEAQNSAEIRSSGGFPGSIGNIRIKDGVLTVGDFATPYDVLYGYTTWDSFVTNQESRLFGPWIDVPRDACFVPDFERSASIIANGYRNQMGEYVDGIVSLTPAIVQDILKVVGPIELSDGTVLDGENATAMLQHELYMRCFDINNIYMYGTDAANDESDALFGESADLAMKALFENINLDTIPQLFDIYDKNVKDRVIMMWMADDEEEAFIKELGCSGCFNLDPEKPEVGVYFSLNDPSKLGWYLGMDVDISEPTKLEGGRMQYDVTVSLENNMPYHDWATGANWIIGNHDGNISASLYIVAPAGGELRNVWSNGWYYFETDDYLDHDLAYNRYLTLYRNSAPVTVHFQVITAAGVTTPLSYHTTPLLQEYWPEE